MSVSQKIAQFEKLGEAEPPLTPSPAGPPRTIKTAVSSNFTNNHAIIKALQNVPAPPVSTPPSINKGSPSIPPRTPPSRPAIPSPLEPRFARDNLNDDEQKGREAPVRPPPVPKSNPPPLPIKSTQGGLSASTPSPASPRSIKKSDQPKSEGSMGMNGGEVVGLASTATAFSSGILEKDSTTPLSSDNQPKGTPSMGDSQEVTQQGARPEDTKMYRRSASANSLPSLANRKEALGHLKMRTPMDERNGSTGNVPQMAHSFDGVPPGGHEGDDEEEDDEERETRSTKKLGFASRKNSKTRGKSVGKKTKLKPMKQQDQEKPEVPDRLKTVNRREKKDYDRVVYVSADSIIKQESYPLICDSQNKFSLEPPCSEERIHEAYINFIDDIYANDFFGFVHLNFVGVHSTKSAEVFIVSVRKPPFGGSFMALKTNKKGTQSFSIPTTDLTTQKQKKNEKTSFEELLSEWLCNNNPGYSFYPAPTPDFCHELKKIESKHPQNQKGIKIAFLYSTGGEKTLQDLFNNNLSTPNYLKFLSLLGEEIQLQGWPNYKGDFGVDLHQISYWTEWRGLEVMFHVCMWMNAEQHRRLIGNDVVFVIFHDAVGTPFEPSPLDALGTVPQVFLVVSPADPEGEYYRIALITRPNIKPYPPLIPPNFQFHNKDLKDFLFTKVYNGYCQALSCPPMNRLFETPRGSTIADLAEKYPKPKASKDKKEPQKKTGQGDDGPGLWLEISTIEPLQADCDPYCQVTLGEEKKKSKLKKNSRGMERIKFSLIGVDPIVNFLRVEIKDSSHKGVNLGRLELSLLELCAIISEGEKEKWYQLHTADCEEQPTCILLAVGFSENINICPQCALYIVDEEPVPVGSEQIHNKCLICVECSKPKPLSDLIFKYGRLYDGACFKRRFGPPNQSDNNNNKNNNNNNNNVPLNLSPLKLEGFGGLGSQHNWQVISVINASCLFCSLPVKDGLRCSECNQYSHVECKCKVAPSCRFPSLDDIKSQPGFSILPKSVPSGLSTPKKPVKSAKKKV